jgi:predicted transcriptional regulator
MPYFAADLTPKQVETMYKLTAKEEEVMEHIWTLGTCAPKDVVALYPDDERPHINSVANAFQSLEKKGYLTHRQRGRGYIYEPIITQKAYGRTKLSNFVDRYFGGSYLDVVSSFVNEEKLTQQELMEFLEQQIQAHPLP